MGGFDYLPIQLTLHDCMIKAVLKLQLAVLLLIPFLHQNVHVYVGVSKPAKNTGLTAFPLPIDRFAYLITGLH